MTKNLLNIFKMQTLDFENENIKLPKEIDEILVNIVLFAAIWSIGVALEEKSRKEFNSFIVRLIVGDPDVIEEFNTELKFKHEIITLNAKF